MIKHFIFQNSRKLIYSVVMIKKAVKFICLLFAMHYEKKQINMFLADINLNESSTVRRKCPEILTYQVN